MCAYGVRECTAINRSSLARVRNQFTEQVGVRSSAAKRLSALIEPMPDMTTAERLRVTLKLSQAGLEMKRQQFVRDFPDEDKAQILQRMLEWQCQRKEAPTGDFPGPTRELT